jgi:hypothetical protein
VARCRKIVFDVFPLELPSTISAAERENLEACAKLPAMRKARKKKPRLVRPGRET